MSVIAMSLAIQTKTSDPLAKLLLLLLADRHNGDTGACFPSIARLTEDSDMSRRTVITKLGKLEDEGFIISHVRRRPNGSRTSNSYTLLFVPQGAGDAPGGVQEPHPHNRKRLTTPALPPENWQPPAEEVAKIRSRYPHHDASDDTICYITREWIDYCHAKGVRYVDFNAAWRNNAEKHLRRQSARPAAARFGARKRGGAGSLSAAIRRSLNE